MTATPLQAPGRLAGGAQATPHGGARQPLSHHEIITLVAPFSAAGWALDLAASDRLQRKLVFRGADPALQAVQAWLELEGLNSGSWQLTRHATHPASLQAGLQPGPRAGLQAQVQALALPPAELLAQVGRLPVERHFSTDPGVVQSRSYAVRDGGSVVLTRGVAVFTGSGPALTLTMDVAAVRGVAADILITAPTDELALPEDLLAVLGWYWTRLIPANSGRAGSAASGSWKTKLRLRGSLQARTAQAEHALDRAAQHVARTLADGPGRFHDRHARSRYLVMLRRAIPIITPVLLVATILLMPPLDTSQGMGLWMLLYHVPTVLIMISFCLQELPTLKPPPWPRRSTAPDWRRPAAALP